MRSLRLASLAGAVALATVSCLTPDPEPAGTLSVSVAPIRLSGVIDADYHLRVTNAPGGGGDVVWERAVTSRSHGDGAGGLSYVGPCDASVGPNTVILTLTALYDGDGQVPVETYMNPTPIEREVGCEADRDAAVDFDLTVARQAQQGFFDVAVQCDDIFCSAKLDCCDTSGSTCAPDGSDDLHILFDADGDRGRTLVLGLACTAGVGGAVDTALTMADLVLDCDVNSAAGAFAPDVSVDPRGSAPGNLCPTAGDLATCPAVTAWGSVDAGDYLFQVAVYRGEEQLDVAGGDAHKAYWNVALGVTDLIGDCALRTRATAWDAADAAGPEDGAPYPYVVWVADLDACASEQLTFNDPDAAVTVANHPFSVAATGAAPSVTYAAASLVCTIGEACALAAPAQSGDTVASFGVAPPLPDGLGLDPVTGAIAGTPTALAVGATYTVTAINPGGALDISLDVAVNDHPPAGLSYSPATLGCTVGQACDLPAPTTSGGGAVTAFTISPALPPGLTVDPTSGAISGTPSAVTATATYTVTASNTGGSTTADVTVTVVDIPPASLTYSPASRTCPTSQACSVSAPSHSGGDPVSFAISPPLPAGLSFVPSTGAISGTPTAITGATVYTVTATNSGGSTNGTLTLTTSDGTPPSFSGSVTLNASSLNSLTETPLITYPSASDPSGVAGYDYCVSTSAAPGACNVVSWRAASASPFTATGISPQLTDGASYRVSIRARDVPGNLSAALTSAPWTANTPCQGPGSYVYSPGSFSFTVPACVTTLQLTLWGGGGNGGGGSTCAGCGGYNNSAGGGGGGSGGYAVRSLSVTPGEVYTLSVGGVAGTTSFRQGGTVIVSAGGGGQGGAGHTGTNNSQTYGGSGGVAGVVTGGGAGSANGSNGQGGQSRRTIYCGPTKTTASGGAGAAANHGYGAGGAGATALFSSSCGRSNGSAGQGGVGRAVISW